jgi:hypothetical protein
LKPNAATRWPHSAYFTVAIRNYHDSGNIFIRSPPAVLAASFDRLGRYEPAATIAGFAANPLVPAAFPETGCISLTSIGKNFERFAARQPWVLGQIDLTHSPDPSRHDREAGKGGETRPLAEGWTYRLLPVAHVGDHRTRCAATYLANTDRCHQI